MLKMSLLREIKYITHSNIYNIEQNKILRVII